MSLSRTCRLLLIALVALTSGCDRGDHPNQLGYPAPQFALNDGLKSADIAKLRGHVVVLNFWATWCAPCVQELPSLETMQQDLPGVQVLAVSTDTDADTYAHFLLQHHVQLLSVRDGTDHSNGLYGTYRYPETYVIDKAGIVRRKFIGPQQWTSPEIEEYLRKLSS